MAFQWGGQLICDTGTNGLNQRSSPTGTSNSLCDIQNLQCFQLVMGFILYFIFFSFCANTKIKITQMLSLSKSSPSCFIPPGALGNKLGVFSSLDGAVVLCFGSCGKAIHVKPSTTHPPVGSLQREHVVALAKMKEMGVCAVRFHLCFPNPFPDRILTATFTGMDYCAHRIHSCAGGSEKHWQLVGRLIPREFPSPAQEYSG